MARRLSYASVVSGNTASSPFLFSQPAIPQVLSQHMNPHQPSNSSMDFSAQPSSFPTRLSDTQHLHNVGQSLPDMWDRGTLPPYSSGFSWWDESRNDWKLRTSEFFVPSYLRRSRHIERLEERHRSRIAARKESKSHRSSNAGSLSSTPSAANLHKIPSSHRGMTHEIIERLPSSNGNTPQPLPSRWSSNEKFSGLELYNDGSEFKFTGTTRSQDEAAAIRADHPIPKECGIYYFEITVLGKGKDSLIGVGVSGPNVALNRIPGWETESWAYHGDDGSAFCQTAPGKNYGPEFGSGDVVGCGVNFTQGSCFFTKNGINLGTACKGVKAEKLYPSVGVKKPGEHIRVNFGKEPFVFDIDKFVDQERLRIQTAIGAHDISRLSHKHEDVVLQQLVVQYLIHDGYLETARAFTKEAYATADLLRNSQAPREISYQDDENASNRQTIRAAILDGDIDKALKMTMAYYPDVLRENQDIYFKLKCRKFIEMICQGTELKSNMNARQSSTSNGHSLDEEDVFNGQMELDGHNNTHDGERMDIEQHDTSMMAMNDMGLMKDALQYGQELSREFKDDKRPEVKKALENTFALIAYPDARESSLAPLLEANGRIPVAEELNSAILVSIGKSSSSALERLYTHTEAMVNMLSEDGGTAALIHVGDDYFRCQ